MSDAPTRTHPPDYGLDAPSVVRNLLLGGAAGLLLWGTVATGLWSGRLVVGPVAGITLIFPLANMGLWLGMGLTAMGLWMIWSSKIGKLRFSDPGGAEGRCQLARKNPRRERRSPGLPVQIFDCGWSPLGSLKLERTGRGQALTSQEY